MTKTNAELKYPERRPYRVASPIEVYKAPPSFGLIVKPKTHQCNLPKPTSWIGRLFAIIFRTPIVELKDYDLWRCPECKQVYSAWRFSKHNKSGYNHLYNCNHGCHNFCSYWCKTTIDDWIKAGGSK